MSRSMPRGNQFRSGVKPNERLDDARNLTALLFARGFDRSADL